MRNTADRIRQAISFEVLGLLIVTPLFAWMFDRSLGEMGGLTVLGATAPRCGIICSTLASITSCKGCVTAMSTKQFPYELPTRCFSR
jgi:hypothetical protein